MRGPLGDLINPQSSLKSTFIPVQEPLLPLDDEADGGETHCHEVGDAEDDTGGHELREGWLIASIHWSLELTA